MRKKSIDTPAEAQRKKHENEKADEASEESFPASDPPRRMIDKATKPKAPSKDRTSAHRT